MKKLILILITISFGLLLQEASGQTLNWRNLKPGQKHIVSLNAGVDNGSFMGVGYGYKMKTKLPLVLNLDYSMPFGEKLTEDFKTRVGAQLNLIQSNSFYATLRAQGVFRRSENDFATLLNFGSEFAGTAGIYKGNWWVAGELGFDKAIVTHVRHSDLMKQYNPQVQSGWYIPTGGNFFYGLQAGYSFGKNDLSLKGGRTVGEDRKTTATFPVYFQLGWSRRF